MTGFNVRRDVDGSVRVSEWYDELGVNAHVLGAQVADALRDFFNGESAPTPRGEEQQALANLIAYLNSRRILAEDVERVRSLVREGLGTVTGPAILSQLTGDAARARATDPETSHAAADSITAEGREASELEVLAILAASDRPLSSEQIEARHVHRAWQGDAPMTYTGQRLRTALKQLADDRLVKADGEVRTKSGRRARAWRTTTEGDHR